MSVSSSSAPRRFIEPGLPWPDDCGRPIQAHGGAVVRHGDAWWWFGEDRSPDNDPVHRCGHASRYSIARVGVAIADTIDGEYRYVRSFRPLRQESRDIGQFIDDDGHAYLIFESRPAKGFFIARLTEDRLDTAEQVAFIPAAIEGGAIVRHEGLYYCTGSHLTGWWPNANKYLTAERLEGPWSEPKDFAPPETATFGSQSTNLLKVSGTKQTTVLYLGDMWRPYELSDSRYLWHPLEIGGGRLELKPKGWVPAPWAIDVRTGEVTYS